MSGVVPSCASVADLSLIPNGRQLSGGGLRDYLQHFAGERPNVFKPNRGCANQKHHDLELREVLLTRRLPIHGDERIEFLFRECQQVTVLNPAPAAFLNRSDLVADEIAREPTIHALIEEHLHFTAAASTRSFASSRNAITCSRESSGSRQESLD